MIVEYEKRGAIPLPDEALQIETQSRALRIGFCTAEALAACRKSVVLPLAGEFGKWMVLPSANCQSIQLQSRSRR